MPVAVPDCGPKLGEQGRPEEAQELAHLTKYSKGPCAPPPSSFSIFAVWRVLSKSCLRFLRFCIKSGVFCWSMDVAEIICLRLGSRVEERDPWIPWTAIC